MLEPTPTWTANIGWIKPGPVSKIIDQFFRVTPPDVNIIISTTMWSLKMTNAAQFDPASLADGQATMIQMARELMAYESMDFLAVTGDLYQAALGPAWNAEMRAALEEATGRPAATAMTAAVDGMRELGLTRLVIAAPVAEVKIRPVADYLEASGFHVLGLQGIATESSRDIRALPFEAPYELAKRAYAAAPGADGIYLPSLTWRATDFAARLEQELGVAVITLYGSLVWRALTAIGYARPISGYGQLLERVGAAGGRLGRVAHG